MSIVAVHVRLFMTSVSPHPKINRESLGCGGTEDSHCVQPTNLQQLRDAVISIWTKISEQCIYHLVGLIVTNIIRLKQSCLL